MRRTFILDTRNTDIAEAKLREFAAESAELLKNDAAHKQYKTTKSGRICSIQYGTTWYEDHDVTVYTPLKVLTDLIPPSEDGYVRHRDAVRLVKRMMQHPGFGTCAQIALMLTVANGAEREHNTILLTKHQ